MKKRERKKSSGSAMLEATMAIPILLLVLVVFLETYFVLKRYIAAEDAAQLTSRILSMPLDPVNPLERESLSNCNNIASADFLKRMKEYGEYLRQDDFEIIIKQVSMKKLQLQGSLQMGCTLCTRVLGFEVFPFKISFSREILLEGDKPFCEVEL